MKSDNLKVMEDVNELVSVYRAQVKKVRYYLWTKEDRNQSIYWHNQSIITMKRILELKEKYKINHELLTVSTSNS